MATVPLPLGPSCDAVVGVTQPITSATGCDPERFEFYAVTGPKLADTAPIYGGSPCKSFTRQPGDEMYPIQKIAASEFVEAHLVTDTSKGRLGTVSFVAADGAKEFFSWWDAQLGAMCSFSATAPDRQARCVPFATASATFTDGACTQPANYAQVSSCSTGAAALVKSSGDTCPSITSVRMTEDPTTSVPALFSREVHSCEPAPSPEIGTLIPRVIAPLGPDQSGTLVAASPPAQGRRLRANVPPVLTDIAPGIPVPYNAGLAWHDTVLDIDCDFIDTTDGVRCAGMTNASVGGALYADPGCTQQSPAIEASSPVACEDRSKLAYLGQTDATCGTPASFYLPGDGSKKTGYAVGPAGNCIADSRGGYLLAREVPPAAFALGRLVVE